MAVFFLINGMLLIMFDVLVPIGISVILKRSNYVYIYDIIKLWRYEQQWNEWLYIYMLYPNAYKPYIAAYLFIQRNRNIKTTGWASKKPTVIASNMCTRINVYTYCIYI